MTACLSVTPRAPAQPWFLARPARLSVRIKNFQAASLLTPLPQIELETPRPGRSFNWQRPVYKLCLERFGARHTWMGERGRGAAMLFTVHCHTGAVGEVGGLSERVPRHEAVSASHERLGTTLPQPPAPSSP